MKRTSQVALVLMGATAVGASAYSLMPRDNCQPGGANPQSAECRSRSSGGSSAHAWGSSSSSNSRTSQAPTGQQSSFGATIRSGFGSVGRAIGGAFGRGG